MLAVVNPWYCTIMTHAELNACNAAHAALNARQAWLGNLLLQHIRSMLTSRLGIKRYSCSRPKHIVTVELIPVDHA